MVPQDDTRDSTNFESLAKHCRDTGDHIIFTPECHGWRELVGVLNKFDGEWRRAVLVKVTELGIGMEDHEGNRTLYPWIHFGVTDPSFQL